VLLDVPMDIQRSEVRVLEETHVVEPRALGPIVPSAIEELIDALRRAQRPLVLVGGGVRAGRAADQIHELLMALGVPVVNSLMGVDVLPASSDLRVGMIGSYGNRWANLAVGRSDFLLVLGSRLDIRQTGSETDAFKAGREIFHVDVDAGEMNNRVTGVRPILADLKRFAEAALPAARAASLPDRSAWIDEIRDLRSEWPDTEETRDATGINPNVLMHQLSAASGDAAIYVADVGQHQMWAAQSLQLLAGQRFLTSGGLGSMGFGLPAAIGASFAAPGRTVVLVAGDGGFQTNIQELQTVARNQLPLKMLIVNNRTHGMVRQFQQSYFDSRFQSTVWGYSAPDFAAVAGAYGIPSRSIGTEDRAEAALSWLLAGPGPALLEVLVPAETNVYPKLAFGRPITEMEPFAKPVGMEST
jgi:acetolactate synthase-1/2/3 large subunit